MIAQQNEKEAALLDEELDEALDREEELESVRGGAGFGTLLTTAVISAAIGAGTALLYAPEPGVKTRKRVNRALGRWQGVAEAQFEIARRRGLKGALREVARQRAQRQRRQKRMIGLAGTLAGAGLALLFAPGRGSRIRHDLGDRANALKDTAAYRIQEIRHRRRGETRSTFDEHRERTEPNRPVRSVEELGREETQVF